MKLNIQNSGHTDHISSGDFIRMSKIDPEDMQGKDYLWLREIDKKIDSCEICQKRLKRFTNISTLIPNAFEPILPLRTPLFYHAVEIIKNAVTNADEVLRVRISSWLESTQNVLSTFEQSSLTPLEAGAFRGGAHASQAEITITVSVEESGFFEFELPRQSKLKFQVKRETDCGQPICLVLFGRGKTVCSAVFPLTEINGSERLGTDPRVLSLENGEYVICIPILTSELE